MEILNLNSSKLYLDYLYEVTGVIDYRVFQMIECFSAANSQANL